MHPPLPVPPARLLCRAACSLALGLAALAPAAPAPVPGPPAPQDPPSPTDAQQDLLDVDVDALEQRVLDIAEALRRALLEPDPEVVRAQRKLLVHQHTGVARILNGEGVTLPRPRGGGCYFSFATELHSYDHQPDLSLRGGRFHSGFYGGQSGAVLPLGEVDLLDLPLGPDPAPEWLPEGRLDAWATLWRPLDEGAPEPEGQPSALRDLRLHAVEPRLGHSYLLRMHSPGEHDHLVAFQVVQEDPYGCTIAWRRLEDWPVLDPRTPQPMPEPDTGPLPPSLEGLDVPELLEALERMSARAEAPLFHVPPQLAEDHRSSLALEDDPDSPVRTGVPPTEGPGPRPSDVRYARVLARGRYDHMVHERGGGAYLALLDGSHSFDDAPDLEYISGSLLSGFSGSDQGFFLDLGELSLLQERALFADRVPEGLSGNLREGLTALRDVRCAPREDPRDRLTVDRQALERLQGCGAARRVPMRVGHTYVLRTLLLDDHDLRAALTVLEGDDDGLTLAWRVLEVVRPSTGGDTSRNGQDGGPASSGVPRRRASDDRR